MEASVFAFNLMSHMILFFRRSRYEFKANLNGVCKLSRTSTSGSRPLRLTLRSPARRSSRLAARSQDYQGMETQDSDASTLSHEIITHHSHSRLPMPLADTASSHIATRSSKGSRSCADKANFRIPRLKPCCPSSPGA